jgi:phage portal protein BeeE
MVARLVAGVRYVVTGDKGSWFGPGQPMQPVAQDQARGRQFDFPFGANMRIQPRSGEAVTFEQMRALADGYDVLRLVIETRKDQMAKLRWTIKPRDEKKEPDQRCQDIAEFLRFPDQEHNWQTWLRMLLEDLLVLDAPVIYPRATVGGGLYALEPVDGGTIKRVIDATGRTPVAPDPAYQQVLKGLPAVDYSRDELIYAPRNVRTNRLYGYSPVEQIIMTVNIALRRQLFTLNYFTEGTVPDALAGVPSEWTTAQIQEFQTYWDLLLSDDQASRRKLKFVPGDIAKAFHEVKAPPLKDEFDEWLARIVCFAFSIAPTPFVKQQNRATAQTAHEASLQEGLAPLQNWVCDMMDLLLSKWFKAPDLHFAWYEEEATDPLEQAQINQIYVAAKVLHPDEVRADLGRDPLTPKQKADLNPPPPPMLAGPGADDNEPPKPGATKPTKPEDDAGKYLPIAWSKKKVL